MVFCENCGKQIGGNFCGNCGHQRGGGGGGGKGGYGGGMGGGAGKGGYGGGGGKGHSGAYRDVHVDVLPAHRAPRFHMPDQRMGQDSFDYNGRHHHAATVHGVVHCRGGKPLRKGAVVKIGYGEMAGHAGRITAMEGNPVEHTIVVEGGPPGREWEEAFVERKNEYGQFVFPLHQVQ